MITGSSAVGLVDNDPTFDGKDHLFPWATVNPAGDVYVGWYDDRNDPSNA
jgi:hypothetical protein